MFGCIAALCCAVAAPGLGGPEGYPCAGAPRLATSDADLKSGHGWLAAPVNAGGAVLVHVPPRDDAEASHPGTVRVALPLDQMPEALAAWDDRVWLVFKTETVRRHDPEMPRVSLVRRLRPVLSVTAQRTPVGTWEYGPGQRPETQASLPGDGDLVSVAGSAAGPLALLHRPGDGEGDGWRLLLLTGGEWKQVPLLPSFALGGGAGAKGGDPADVRLITTGQGPALFRRVSSGRYEMWVGTIGAGADGAVAINWTTPPVAFDGVPGLNDAPALGTGGASAQAMWCDGQVVTWSVGPGRLDLWSLKPSGAWPLAYTTDAPGPAAVVPLDGIGRIAIIWPKEQASSQPNGGGHKGPPAPTEGIQFRYSEISAFTGREMYLGSAKRDSILSARDFQVLTLVFGAIMLAVLFFVLRTDSRQEVTIPAGTSLAPPGRRAIAGALDVGPAFLVACSLVGVSPSRALSPLVLSTPGTLFSVMGLALGLTILHCAVGEWLWGRSIGKAATGCRVVSLPNRSAEIGDKLAGSTSLSLWQAILRNAVRWAFPPLGMLMLFDPAFRHPGDLVSRTVVVMVDDPRPPAQDDPEG